MLIWSNLTCAASTVTCETSNVFSSPVCLAKSRSASTIITVDACKSACRARIRTSATSSDARCAANRASVAFNCAAKSDASNRSSVDPATPVPTSPADTTCPSEYGNSAIRAEIRAEI